MAHPDDVYMIHRFDLARIVPGSVVLVLGARGTGKTTIIKDLMYHMKHYPIGTIMVDTLDTAAEYAEHLPDSLIYNQYDPKVVSKLIEQQESQIQACKQNHVTPPIVRSPKFLILDDLGFNKSIQKDPVLRRIYSNGRHFKLTTIIAAQYCMQVPKECRLMFDYIFTTYEKTMKYRQQIYDEFDVGFPDEATLHAIMTKCTEDYGVMVLDKRSTGKGGLNESVFHYRAKFARKFTVGSQALWDWHRKHFNPMYSYIKPADVPLPKSKRRIRVRRINKINRSLNI